MVELSLICSLFRLLPNLVDNLVNRVLANVLPDLVRARPRTRSRRYKLSPERGATVQPPFLQAHRRPRRREGARALGRVLGGLERALRVGGRVQPRISKCGGSGPGPLQACWGPSGLGKHWLCSPLILLSLRVPPCYPIYLYPSSPPLPSHAPRT